ncbi:phage distal tail protein, Rcc01695 family [Hoeflea sp.]|uniref:phage distal tail protein, Rcc01695 family n=1 Tax=Hoeflea sp. TaxID=1940281 RepID=UPI003B518506
MSDGFHEIRLPLRLSLGASGGPGRRTDIVALSNGGETRNARWADSRRRYDVGTGLRSLEDLYQLIAFFEARRGQLYGFRFRDPVDHRSGAHGETVNAIDQVIGEGDGVRTLFELTKTYADSGGATPRRIEKPVEGSVQVAIDGVGLDPEDFSVDTQAGLVTIAPALTPPPGVPVTAGYEFDIPVRFDTDRIEISLAAFRAGSVPVVPLVEIRP